MSRRSAPWGALRTASTAIIHDTTARWAIRRPSDWWRYYDAESRPWRTCTCCVCFGRGDARDRATALWLHERRAA
jgi:hypothetical protein